MFEMFFRDELMDDKATFKVYMTDFFLFAWSNLHVVLVWKSKK